MLNTNTIDPRSLDTVTGGAGGKPEPVKPAIPNFGGMRYTADWWAKYNASQAGQR
ncbi:MAG TPA: hypothetical protein VIV11_12165 [Kofleriaceae bacterium]